VSSGLRCWLHAPFAWRELWQVHCERAGVNVASDDDAMVAYGRHAATLCADCRRPTRYSFILLRRRLCEECERCNPQRYALATELQLVHERSSLASLSVSQRRKLLSGLPSLELGGATWFLRSAAVTAAAEACESSGSFVSGAAPSHEYIVTTSASSARAASDPAPASVDCDVSSGEEDVSIDVSAAWEVAAMEHKEKRAPSNARKAEQREAQKAHKKAVKAAARAKREGGAAGQPLPRSLSSPRGAAPGSSHKPKRASAREHRERAVTQLDPWERQYQELELLLGVDLAGLTGLLLACE